MKAATTVVSGRFGPAARLALIAAGLLLPTAIGPVPLNDSHWINLVWSHQFSAAMRDGIAWPRWLPASHGGLGAPVFFFYGPITFWVAGLFALSGAAVWPSLLLTAYAGLLLSGLGMWLLLRRQSPNALPIAVLFMGAPYHLLDFTRRGALAEFMAASLLPWLALAVRRAVAGRFEPLALTYAVLILTHLPTALLTSVFAVPMLALEEAGHRGRAWARIMAGMVIGAALAAVYLLPALMLQETTAMTRLSSLSYLQPAAWSIWTMHLDQSAGITLVYAIGAAIGVTSAVTLATHPNRWSAFTAGVVLLALGVVPDFWTMPLLDRVQFPWRILTLAEFGAAMAIARGGLSARSLLLAAAPMMVMTILVFDASLHAPDSDGSRIAKLLRDSPDVTEYLPRGTGEPVAIQSDWALRLASRTPPRSTANGITTLHHFAFPAWGVRCGDLTVPTWPQPGTGLLQYHASRAPCTPVRIATNPERAGGTISILALVVLAVVAFLHRRPAQSCRRRAAPRSRPCVSEVMS